MNFDTEEKVIAGIVIGVVVGMITLVTVLTAWDCRVTAEIFSRELNKTVTPGQVFFSKEIFLKQIEQQQKVKVELR